ncbi:MAG: hypothetical protein BM564_10720 [Bacteroidetes bacterium MedPE-SWsnd-G2]|nr:MAG: hypothetical protein BM564_10720 [Bacteroidetes bacterium MedPE-SWsnd-G2]
MKLTTQLLTALVFSGLGVLSMQSQSTSNNEPAQIVHYNDNVQAPLSAKELGQIQEAFGEFADDAVLNNPQRLKDVKNILRNRVVIEHIPNKDLSSINSLNSVSVFNIYNPNLQRDITFNATEFNPLKYYFDFSYSKEQLFWIDNTEYIIRIKHQHQN